MKMKRIYAAAALLFAAAVPNYAFAACTSYGGDPCKTFLCMSGRVQGEGTVSGCPDAVGGYFSIRCYNKHGFDAPRTLIMRNSHITQCQGTSGENQSWVQKISAKYGAMEYDNGS